MENVTAIFSEAGWTPGQRDGWNGAFVWTDQSVIGGVDPWGVPRVCVVGARTHDEAAAWLVEHAKALRLEPLAPVPEPEETPAHEDDAETGADDLAATNDASDGDELGSGDDVSVRLPARLEHVDALGTEGLDDVSDEDADDERAEPDLGAEILDADYSESIDLLVEGSDFADVAIEPDAPGAFIFGDNLHQMRTAAIGLVVQAALERMPAGIDYARMSELRNFTMGVSESRWPDDPDKREELDTLEATERLRRRIEAIRDGKVQGLLTATRWEIEQFNAQEGWP